MTQVPKPFREPIASLPEGMPRTQTASNQKGPSLWGTIGTGPINCLHFAYSPFLTESQFGSGRYLPPVNCHSFT